MDDALVPTEGVTLSVKSLMVLILVLMDDALVQVDHDAEPEITTS